MRGMIKVILGAVLVAVVGLAVWLALVLYAQHWIHQSFQTMADSQVQRAQRMHEVAIAQSRHMTDAPVGRVLSADERCIGGSIVRITVDHGVPTYTQLSDGMRPLACPG